MQRVAGLECNAWQHCTPDQGAPGSGRGRSTIKSKRCCAGDALPQPQLSATESAAAGRHENRIRRHPECRVKRTLFHFLAKSPTLQEQGRRAFRLPPVGYFKLFLELHAQRELELTWFCPWRLAGNEDLALIDIYGGSIPARVARVNVIERVVSIQPELCE